MAETLVAFAGKGKGAGLLLADEILLSARL